MRPVERIASEEKLRPEIAVSWWRSELLGARPDVPVEAVRSEPLLDADERLRRAVQPVLDELVTWLAGTNSAVILADHRAVLLDRRGTTSAINAEMDRLGIHAGRACAEWSVGTNASDVLPGDLPETGPAGPARLTPMERAERDAIVKALRDARHNKAAAAAVLGISRPTLYRKMSIYGIDG